MGAPLIGGNAAFFAPNAKKIQIDIDPADASKGQVIYTMNTNTGKTKTKNDLYESIVQYF